jgi:hypothetical protein
MSEIVPRRELERLERRFDRLFTGARRHVVASCALGCGVSRPPRINR